MTQLQPINDRILTQPLEDEDKTAGGLYIPNSVSKSPTAKALVIAVGEGIILSNGTRIPIAVKAGDVVLYNRMSGLDIGIDGRNYKVLVERDVIGIIS